MARPKQENRELPSDIEALYEAVKSASSIKGQVSTIRLEIYKVATAIHISEILELMNENLAGLLAAAENIENLLESQQYSFEEAEEEEEEKEPSDVVRVSPNLKELKI